MTKLTLREFLNHTRIYNTQKYIFYSENQDNNLFDDTFKFDIVFSNIKVNFNPNTIFFSTDNQCVIQLEKVTAVIVDNSSVLGIIYTFVCDITSTSHQQNKYTFIAQ